MYQPQTPRALSAGSSAAITLGLIAMLMFGFGAERHASPAEPLVSVSFAEQPPPPKPRERPRERRARKPAPKHEAAPRNLRNQATAIVAPPVQPLIVPPPVLTAPIANLGSAAQTGASDRPGPGQGAGGIGNGFGGGGMGGDGDGTGDGEPVRGPRRTAGRLSFRDLPEAALTEGTEAAVTVIFAVLPDGSVRDCQIDRSSGFAGVDSLTCRLIEQRFRFKPAIDRRGRPVRSLVRETHSWYARPE
jgi:protein TonB